MDELEELLGFKVSYYPNISRITGSINSAILLSRLLYWWEKRSNGLLYKTIKEIEDETCLSKNHQISSIKKLEELDFIQVYLIGVPPKRHFAISIEKIMEALKESSEKRKIKFPKNRHSNVRKAENQFSEKQTFNFPESGKLNFRKPENQMSEKRKYNTMNTTMYTSMITTMNTSMFYIGKINLPNFKKIDFKNFKLLSLKENTEGHKFQKDKINPPKLRATPLDKKRRLDISTNSLHQEMKNIFVESYKSKTGLPYFWTGKDGKHLSELVEKIRFMLQQTKKTYDEDQITTAFQLLLENIDDKWILENLSVAIINSKFNEILLKINGQSQKHKNGRYTISTEYEKSIYQRLFGETMP